MNCAPFCRCWELFVENRGDCLRGIVRLYIKSFSINRKLKRK